MLKETEFKITLFPPDPANEAKLCEFPYKSSTPVPLIERVDVEARVLALASLRVPPPIVVIPV